MEKEQEQKTINTESSSDNLDKTEKLENQTEDQLDPQNESEKKEDLLPKLCKLYNLCRVFCSNYGIIR